jgi:predicted metal-dependent hydrolase
LQREDPGLQPEDESVSFHPQEKKRPWTLVQGTSFCIKMELPYKIIKSKRKTISVEVTPEALVIVKAPLNTGNQFINEFVDKNKIWIVNTLLKVKKKHVDLSPITIQPSEKLLFMGNYYTIVLHDGNDLVLDVNNMCINIPTLFTKRMLKRWYLRKADEILTNKVIHFADKLNAKYTKIKISSGIRTIGSCTTRGVINLSWLLILLPTDVIDYVVVHELCHLFVPNHSSRFWDLVKLTVSDYKSKRLVIKHHNKEFYRYKNI